MSFPSVGGMSEEEKEAVRAEFFTLGATSPESQPVKRGRGRPKGSRNKPRPGDYAPFRSTAPSTPNLEDSEDLTSSDIPNIPTPRLSTRDQREVATRLAGILTAGTGMAAVVKPYFQMTDEEAEAIANPLTTYLLRTEATSKTAAQILDEYDVAAFVLAIGAYVIRVYLDFREERKSLISEREQQQPRNVTPINPTTPGNSTEPIDPSIQEPNLQSQGGEERPVSREYASVSEGGWVPSRL